MLISFLASKEQMEESIMPHKYTFNSCSRLVALEMQYYIKGAYCFKHTVHIIGQKNKDLLVCLRHLQRHLNLPRCS